MVVGLGSPNTLRRVEHGRAVDYPLQIENNRVGEAEVPRRFFYATDPPIEFLNPYADRVLDRGTSTDSLSRAVELDCLYRSIAEGAEPGYSLAQARRDQELAILINEAARAAEPIRV